MADSPQPDPDDCFHCPQGDQPCPVTYQPPGHGWPSSLPSQPLWIAVGGAGWRWDDSEGAAGPDPVAVTAAGRPAAPLATRWAG